MIVTCLPIEIIPWTQMTVSFRSSSNHRVQALSNHMLTPTLEDKNYDHNLQYLVIGHLDP